MDERATREYLIQNDQQFRQLFNEHQAFEKKLAEFAGRPFLTIDEQLEETVLKKKKLALKDRMQVLINEHRAQHAVN